MGSQIHLNLLGLEFYQTGRILHLLVLFLVCLAFLNVHLIYLVSHIYPFLLINKIPIVAGHHTPTNLSGGSRLQPRYRTRRGYCRVARISLDTSIRPGCYLSRCCPGSLGARTHCAHLRLSLPKKRQTLQSPFAAYPCRTGGGCHIMVVIS